VRLTRSRHSIRPPKIAALNPQPQPIRQCPFFTLASNTTPAQDLALRALEEANKTFDGRAEFLAASDLRGLVLCLEIAVECWDENPVDVVGLETDEGAGVWDVSSGFRRRYQHGNESFQRSVGALISILGKQQVFRYSRDGFRFDKRKENVL